MKKKINWQKIKRLVKENKPYLGIALEETKASIEDATLKIILKAGSFNSNLISEKANLDLIKRTINNRYQNKLKIEIRGDKPDKISKKIEGESIKSDKQKKTADHKNPAVNKALNIFGGRIEGN